MDEQFTSLCSSITVQSDQQGFFNVFFECIREQCGDEWINKEFSKIKTDTERLQCMFNDPQVCDSVLGTLEHVKPVYKLKDAQVSSHRRLKGDELMKNGDYKSALLFYSQAVMRAPIMGENKYIDGGISLALALWGRSSVLEKLGEGEKAVQDLQYAVKNNFPIKHRPEYYWRLAKCYSQTNQIQKARVAFNLTAKLLGDNEDSQQLLKEDLQEAEEMALENQTLKEIRKPPQLKNGESLTVKNASELLEVQYDDNKGKHVVAKDSIRTGDAILVEIPFAACLLPKYAGSHCHECFERLVAPIGCPYCSGVAFCSVECKEKACSSYHKYECKYLDLLIGSGMSILCHIALRIITQTNNVETEIAGVRDLLDGLCKHADKRKPFDFLQRSLMTTFLLRCLQHSGFFGRRKTEAVDPSKNELEIGAIILGLLQALQFNAHEIYETRLGDNHRFVGSKPISIGVGIYKTGALFNHDCGCSVSRSFFGKTLVFHTRKPLEKGEVISENYGPIFTKKTLAERQRSLQSRYWFKCECDACTGNWPLLEKMNNTARIKCPTPTCNNILYQTSNATANTKCNKCKEKVNLRESLLIIKQATEFYRTAAELMDLEKTDEAIEIFTKGIDLFYQVAILPHKETHIAQESLRVCLSDKGNCFKI